MVYCFFSTHHAAFTHTMTFLCMLYMYPHGLRYSNVKITGAMTKDNIKWCIGDAAAATFRASSAFQGNLNAGFAITIGALAKVNGDLTAGAAITTGTDVIIGGGLNSRMVITAGANSKTNGALSMHWRPSPLAPVLRSKATSMPGRQSPLERVQALMERSWRTAERLPLKRQVAPRGHFQPAQPLMPHPISIILL